MEIESCGNLGVGTTACVFTQGQTVSGTIDVRVPFTNTTQLAASVEFISADCNVDQKLSGLPGQTISIPVADFLGDTATQTCSVQIEMNPTWDKQSTFTFPVSPLVGRVLILTMDNPPTEVTYFGQLFPALGFATIDEVSAGAPAPTLGSMVVNSQGSNLGQVILQGCGQDGQVWSFTGPNPPIPIPRASSSCVLLGVLQAVDQARSYSFAMAVNVIPAAYKNLAPPTLISVTEGDSDPMVSAVDLGISVVQGGQFPIPSSIGSPYYIRQITTGGRYSLTYVTNGVIDWTAP
jgi:hypothetical protein